MKAAVYYEPGPPSVLTYEDVDDPKCLPGHVLVRHEAISIEGGDILARAMFPPSKPPSIVGYQAAGEIIEVGEGVTDRSVGQRVVSVQLSGSHAELRAVPAPHTWVLPDGLGVKAAAAVPVSFLTASDCLFEHGGLESGEVVLVHAGAGAVGIACIQLAKRAGATVLATASSDAKLARLEGLGLDHGINYVETDFAEEVKRLTEGKGADLIIDSVGTTLDKDTQALAYRGRICFLGVAGRGPTPINPQRLMDTNGRLFGYYLGFSLMKEFHRAGPMVKRHLADVAAGELEVVLDKEFSLADAAAAHAHVESRTAVGRVLLIP